MPINKLAIDYKKYVEKMKTKDFVIVDPPWCYNNKAKAFASKTEFKKIVNNVEILNYLFKNVKSKVLLLWITSPLLGYLLDRKFSISYGDYSYKQILTWVKTTNSGDKIKGSGFWFKNTCEYLVLFTTKVAKPIYSRVLSFCEESATKNSQTQKPKNFESSIIRELYNSGYLTSTYLFSGIFSDYDISKKQSLDLVDIIFSKENKNAQ